MFSMELNQIIRCIYDMNEPVMIDMDYKTGEQTVNGLLFAFDISVSYWYNHNEYNERRKIYVVLGPHKAWCAETSTSYSRIRNFDDFMLLNWVNVGNHNSCWINSVDSWLSALYFNLCHSIRDDIIYDEKFNCRPIQGLTPVVMPKIKSVDLCDYHIFVHAPLCEKLFKSVTIKFGRENNNHKRALLQIT